MPLAQSGSFVACLCDATVNYTKVQFESLTTVDTFCNIALGNHWNGREVWWLIPSGWQSNNTVFLKYISKFNNDIREDSIAFPLCTNNTWLLRLQCGLYLIREAVSFHWVFKGSGQVGLIWVGGVHQEGGDRKHNLYLTDELKEGWENKRRRQRKCYLAKIKKEASQPPLDKDLQKQRK